MKNIVIGVSVLMIFLVAGCSSGPDMKEGKWSITTEVSMTGLPMKVPAMSHEQCLTKKDMIPQEGQQGNQNCTVKDQKINGNTVTWKVICKGGNGESTSDGTITYKGESFTGTINVVMTGGPMTMKASNTLTGKYLGPCK